MIHRRGRVDQRLVATGQRGPDRPVPGSGTPRTTPRDPGHGTGGQVWRVAAETLVPAADLGDGPGAPPAQRGAPLQPLKESEPLMANTND